MGKPLRVARCLVAGLATALARAQTPPPDPCSAARVALAQEHFAEAAPLFETCHQASRQLDPLFQAAKSYFFAGDDAKAADLATQFLGRDPSAFQAMYLLGHIEERRQNPRDSLHWFTRAAALDPPHSGDLRIVALDYVLLNDYPDALHWLHRAVALDPNDAEAWYDLGRAQMTQGDMPGAEISLHRALALKPHLVKAENNLGVVDEAQNRPADAIAAYRLAIAWQTGDPHPSEQPLLNLGTLLVTQQHPAEAIDPLRQAVALAPQSPKAHEQLARALDAAGRLAAALPEMLQAVQLDPKNPRLHYELGQMARRAGQLDLARQHLRLSSELYGETSTSPDQ